MLFFPNETKNSIITHRNERVTYILKYFTDIGAVSIRTKYDNNYIKNTHCLFHFLPELFDFIKNQNIKRLDLSCVTSYGGYPEDPYKIVSNNKDDLYNYLMQLLLLISKDTTLTSCNYYK